MRLNDLEITLGPIGEGTLKELADGRVMARPGQVYVVRVQNHDARRRMVVHVAIDGTNVSRDGLVLDPGELLKLERPLDDTGRFTVFAEGDERVFGDDGGRGNPDLGLIEVRGRREQWREPPRYALASWDSVHESPLPGLGDATLSEADGAWDVSDGAPRVEERGPTIESAAGTGLTGRSDQSFVPVHVGPLEPEETIVRLRLVIGSVDALLDEPRPLRTVTATPVPPRPPARP
jgi:hypothetical protein